MNLEKHSIKAVVGFIIYGQHTAKYLPFFLSSLKAQSFADYKIIAFNNGDEGGENLKFLSENYPEIKVIGEGVNLGFAAAYNRMISSAVAERIAYFLMINSDIILESDVLEKLTRRLDADKDLGSVCPKILKWDFVENKKTDTVDSYGIGLKNGLRFYDVGQGEKDKNDFRYARVIGPSGACGLYSLAALEKVKEGGNYLDENMFMYKEDCDLAYRLHLTDWEAACVPEAVAYHARTASGGGRGDWAALKSMKNKSQAVRCWSFRNQEMIFHKYWRLQSWRSKLAIIFYRFKKLVYALIFDWALIKVFLSFQGEKSKIRQYR